MPYQEHTVYHHPPGLETQYQQRIQPFGTAPQRQISRDFAYGHSFAVPMHQHDPHASFGNPYGAAVYPNGTNTSFPPQNDFSQGFIGNNGFALHYDAFGNQIPYSAQYPTMNDNFFQFSGMNDDISQFLDPTANAFQPSSFGDNGHQSFGVNDNISQFSVVNGDISHLSGSNGNIPHFPDSDGNIPHFPGSNGMVSQHSNSGTVDLNNNNLGAVIGQDKDAEGSIIKNEPTDDNFPDMDDVPAFVEPESITENSATPSSSDIAPEDSDAQTTPDEVVIPAQNPNPDEQDLPRDTFDKYLFNGSVRPGYIDSLRPLCPKGRTTAPGSAMRRARRAWLGANPPRNDAEGRVYLLVARVWGRSYQQIKDQGNITKAVPTLRGSWRTMTKPPADRVRKPEWTALDDTLLMVGHRVLTGSGTPRALWKKLGDWIVEHGGRYHFGPAAVKKRWALRAGRQ